jgi:hypothetical protein
MCSIRNCGNSALQIRNCGGSVTVQIRNYGESATKQKSCQESVVAKIVPGIIRPGRTRLPTALILSYALIAMLPCVFLLYRVNHNL